MAQADPVVYVTEDESRRRQDTLLYTEFGKARSGLNIFRVETQTEFNLVKMRLDRVEERLGRVEANVDELKVNVNELNVNLCRMAG